MPEAVICLPMRTPSVSPGVCSETSVRCRWPVTVIAELVRHSGLSSRDIDDVILGQTSPERE